MTRLHLSERALQQAAESAPPLPAPQAAHLRDCRLCQGRVAAYQHLFAAAAHLPLIVILAESDKARTSMAEAVAKPAWGKTYLGHFTYAEAKKADDLPKLAALKSMDSIVFIEPDRFGQTGTVIEQLKPDSTQEEIEKAMNTLLKKHTVITLTERAFREAAVKAGAFWEPKLTVSDPQEQRAREETKRRIEMMKK